MSSFARRWRALLIGLTAFAVAAGVHGIFHALSGPGTRPVPSLAAVPWLVAGFGVAAMLASTVAMVRRTEGGLAKLGAGTLHVLITVAGLAGVGASDPELLFGSFHVESLTLPEDRGTAYLYRGGLFCGQSVWHAASGQWWSTHDREAGSFTCDREGHLRWDAEHARVDVVGADGRRLPAPSELEGLGEGLNWGPR